MDFRIRQLLANRLCGYVYPIQIHRTTLNCLRSNQLTVSFKKKVFHLKMWQKGVCQYTTFRIYSVACVPLGDPKFFVGYIYMFPTGNQRSIQNWSKSTWVFFIYKCTVFPYCPFFVFPCELERRIHKRSKQALRIGIKPKFSKS